MDFKHIKMLTKAKAQILLYGDIGGTEMLTARYVANEIDFLVEYGEVDEIIVRVNSRGGDMIEGFGIVSALQVAVKKGINVITQNDGVAASMGVPIMLAAKERKMKDFALMMIHDPWGNRGDEVLNKFKESVLKIFTSVSKVSKEKLEEMMTEETWLSAEEALELGFITEIIPTEANIANKFGDNLNANELIEVYNQINNSRKSFKTEDNMEEIAVSLGLPKTATKEEINAAIVKMKAAPSTPVKTTTDNGDKGNVEVLMALGRANGHINDGNIEDFRAIAKTNYARVFSLVGKPKPKPEIEAGDEGGEESITLKNVIAALNGGGGLEQPKAETKLEMYLRLSKAKDTTELATIKATNPKLFNEMEAAYIDSLDSL